LRAEDDLKILPATGKKNTSTPQSWVIATKEKEGHRTTCNPEFTSLLCRKWK
jgi:hypothetical protein